MPKDSFEYVIQLVETRLKNPYYTFEFMDYRNKAVHSSKVINNHYDMMITLWACIYDAA